VRPDGAIIQQSRTSHTDGDNVEEERMLVVDEAVVDDEASGGDDDVMMTQQHRKINVRMVIILLVGGVFVFTAGMVIGWFIPTNINNNNNNKNTITDNDNNDPNNTSDLSFYCSCPTCTQEIWDTVASDFSCGARIEWLQSTSSYTTTETEACMKVAGREFPIPCGPCNTFICDPQTQRILPEPNDDDATTPLAWYDEFDQEDGTAPDPTKWKYDIGGNGWGNFEQQYYTNDLHNAFVRDGILHIRAAATTTGNYNNAYTSARLVSRGLGENFRYGRFRARVRLSNCTAVGTWPAVWMLPTDNLYGIWPLSGEIDIMEHVGYNAGVIHGSLHTQSYNGMIGTQKTSGIHLTDDDFNDWHVYDVMWTPDRIEFAVDNLVYHEYTRPDDFTFAEWPFDQRFHLLMNVAVGGSWGGKEGINATAFEGDGQVLEIDWVRVYQY